MRVHFATQKLDLIARTELQAAVKTKKPAGNGIDM